MNKKILIICEARPPQVNGVVTTFKNVQKELETMGYDVDIIGPDHAVFRTISLPFYKEIDIVLNPWAIKAFIDSDYDYIHIATEGPLGFYAANYCAKKRIRFSTSYHTKMPEYINAKFPFIPTNLVYSYMRRLHKYSTNVLVTCNSMKKELIGHNFKNNFVEWTRGVDHTIFNSSNPLKRNRPYLLYVGRVSIEKNIEAFLDLDLPKYDKIVVGNGPDLSTLQHKYRYHDDIVFLGARFGEELASIYAGADCFVFPSKTDTFGIVIIEAISCGTLVAAYDVTGPKDIIKWNSGECNNSLHYSVCVVLHRLLTANTIRKECELYGQTFTWKRCANIFVDSLVAR